MRKAYLKGERIETVYFGGGTPSQLEEEDFKQIFGTLQACYGMEHCYEITLEANPDDLSVPYMQMLSTLPSTASAWVYRLSTMPHSHC